MIIGHLVTGIFILVFLISGYKGFVSEERDYNDWAKIMFLTICTLILIMLLILAIENWNTKLF